MKLKTKIIILCSICFAILIGGIIADNLMGKSYLNKINISDLFEKIENKEDLILLISKTDCSHCISYKPKLEKMANKYKLNVYYIEVDLLSKEEYDKLYSNIRFDGTPVTVFLKDGEEKTVVNRIEGNASIEKIEKKLKSNGFID